MSAWNSLPWSESWIRTCQPCGSLTPEDYIGGAMTDRRTTLIFAPGSCEVRRAAQLHREPGNLPRQATAWDAGYPTTLVFSPSGLPLYSVLPQGYPPPARPARHEQAARVDEQPERQAEEEKEE